jgi:hypothetical protein
MVILPRYPAPPLLLEQPARKRKVAFCGHRRPEVADVPPPLGAVIINHIGRGWSRASAPISCWWGCSCCWGVALFVYLAYTVISQR